MNICHCGPVLPGRNSPESRRVCLKSWRHKRNRAWSKPRWRWWSHHVGPKKQRISCEKKIVWCSNVDGKDVMKNHFLAIHCEVMMIVIGPRDQHIRHHPSSIHHLSDLLYIIHSFSWGEHALRINDDLQWFLCCCRYFHWNGHRNWCYSGAEWDGHVWVAWWA